MGFLLRRRELPLSHLNVGSRAGVDFTRPGGGSWPPRLPDPFLSSEVTRVSDRVSRRVGETVLNSVLDLCYLGGISSCLLGSRLRAFVFALLFETTDSA